MSLELTRDARRILVRSERERVADRDRHLAGANAQHFQPKASFRRRGVAQAQSVLAVVPNDFYAGGVPELAREHDAEGLEEFEEAIADYIELRRRLDAKLVDGGSRAKLELVESTLRLIGVRSGGALARFKAGPIDLYIEPRDIETEGKARETEYRER